MISMYWMPIYIIALIIDNLCYGKIDGAEDDCSAGQGWRYTKDLSDHAFIEQLLGINQLTKGEIDELISNC